MAPGLPPSPGEDQQLLGFLSNAEWDGLIGEVNALIEQMEALPAGRVREGVFRLLDGIDAIHRGALRRLVRLFKEGVMEKVVTDPAIHTLMELYDLLPAGLPQEPAISNGPKFATIPIRVARPAPAAPRYPHWVPVLTQQDALSAGSVRDDIVADGLPVLLARQSERWYAMDARCPVDGVPLQGAVLNGYTLTCPSHSGCHYDVRNGARIGGGRSLGCYPVRVDPQGRVLLGLDMDFEPELPSF